MTTTKTLRRLLSALSLAAVLAAAAAAPAAADVPAWSIRSYAVPANLPPGGSGEVIVTATNLGTDKVNATLNPFLVSDNLPPQLTATSIQVFSYGTNAECELASPSCEASAGELPPYFHMEMRIKVSVANTPPATAVNTASISGGGAKGQSNSETVHISSEPVSFGVQSFESVALNEDGTAATRAGTHPFQYTTTFQVNEKSFARPTGTVKDLRIKLPPGLIGNTTAIPQCTAAQFTTYLLIPQTTANACPDDTAIGVASVKLEEVGEVTFGQDGSMAPIFNMVPAAGEPARFAFELFGAPAFLDTSVRSGGDYGITVASNNTSNIFNIGAVQTSIWGVPSDPAHDGERGWSCVSAGFYHIIEATGPCPQRDPTRNSGPAFLRLPTACTGPLASSIEASSWAEPSNFTEPLTYTTNENGTLYGQDSCNQLPFTPTIFAEPTSDAATSPTGFNVHLDLEDQGLTNAEGTAQSDIQKAVVTLPEGFTTNPSVAEGLASCSEAAFESSTVNSEAGTGCPDPSKIGDVELESPLVEQKLKGSIYVAQQGQNPFGNLLTIYMVVANPELGVLIKAPGKVTSDPVTGQITTTFGEAGHELPQLPQSHFRLSFRQGQRSPLITPPACGNYTVQADLYPWSNPSAPIHDESSFQITQGPEGQGCPSGGVPPFHPNLLAGSENPTAGVYSPFYTEITRKDSEQEITHFSIKLPPGVIGKLAGIPECSDAAIAAAKSREREGGGGEEEASPSCPAASLIGHSNVGSGVGNVLAYAPGHLYLAGPYHGSSVSFVSITAAKVGPFDLGTVVVRFALRVDPETGEVFVDSTGSDPIPHIVDGIPVHLRDVQAFVDRPEFTLNPTSCEKTSTASTVLGSGLDFASEADDQPIVITSPFQVANCATLPFKPKLSLTLKGSTKRGGNPALHAHLAMNGVGEAGLAYARTALPATEFLDNAHIGTVCTRVIFKEGAQEGEKCPPGSLIGHAKALTPLLSEPLEGPIYLRSNPERSLPDIAAALHGSEISVVAVGHTDSAKGGGVRNTFEVIPDAPVTSVDIDLFGGKKGLLENAPAGNATSICQTKTYATLNLKGHNGKVSNYKTPLKAAGCKKHKKPKRHRHRHRHPAAG